ncbi:unnamed protein product, partial [Rotaria sp. Silwood2]
QKFYSFTYSNRNTRINGDASRSIYALRQVDAVNDDKILVSIGSLEITWNAAEVAISNSH